MCYMRRLLSGGATCATCVGCLVVGLHVLYLSMKQQQPVILYIDIYQTIHENGQNCHKGASWF